MVEAKTFELGGNKTVSVSTFRGKKLVDIREYYVDKKTGEKKPGKKGIALNEEAWEKLMSFKSQIEESLADLDNEKPTKKAKIEKTDNDSDSNKESSKDTKQEETEDKETV